jgi:hypothetical protein
MRRWPIPRAIEQHGSRIIAALEHAWAAIQDAHPDVPDVVIVTGAGSNQKGTRRVISCAATTGPNAGVISGQDQPRAPELFVAGELLAAGGQAVVEVMLHEAAQGRAAPHIDRGAFGEDTAPIVSFKGDL